MKIIFGTKNKAKILQLQGALSPIGVEVVGLPDDFPLPEVIEDGSTAMENARKKAIAYATALDATVFSMDNALYFDYAVEEDQPGLNVRRIPSKNERPTDEEMLAYYASFVSRFGERTTGYWEFAICIAAPNGNCEEIVIKSPRVFTSIPSTSVVSGYPLESIQIDPLSGRYISEMSQGEQDLFWQRAIGAPLQEFIMSINF